MIVATAGHVDHGKTLLIKALTGTDTDRLPEEKARGLTIDLGFAYHDLGDGTPTGFVDVPGHERFVRTMVAGVSGIDAVLLIVAADDGPMPQTAEHLAILDLLGVTRGVLALTKVDRADPARVAAVTAACRSLLAPTALAALPIVPVSALTGAGLETLRKALLELATATPPRATDGAFRLAIDRSFLLKGAGRVVAGTVVAGQVRTDGTLCHLPGATPLRVRGIHAHNRVADVARAGQRCALNLAGSGLKDVAPARGDWLTDPAVAFTSRRLDIELTVLASEERGLRNRSPVHVHLGAADVTGRLVSFDGAGFAPGSRGLAQLLLDRDLHAVRGDRLVLRDQSARRTVGGGWVVDPLPRLRGHGRATRLARLRAMRAAEPATALGQALDALSEGLEQEPFMQAWNLAPAARDALLATVPHVALDLRGEVWLLAPRHWQALRDAIPPALAALHAQAPERAGVSEIELARALPLRVRQALFGAALAALAAAGTVLRAAGQVRLPAHRVRRSAADEAVWRRVHRALDRADGKVPVVHDLRAAVALELKPLEAFLARAAQQGHLVRVSPRRYYLPETVAGFETMVRELGAHGRFSVADFRDRSGIGRNAVVEILEYFDRIGLTNRQGESRIVIKSGSQDPR